MTWSAGGTQPSQTAVAHIRLGIGVTTLAARTRDVEKTICLARHDALNRASKARCEQARVFAAAAFARKLSATASPLRRTVRIHRRPLALVSDLGSQTTLFLLTYCIIFVSPVQRWLKNGPEDSLGAEAFLSW
jgi:hypothetical protein